VWNLDSPANGGSNVTVNLIDWNSGSGKGDYVLDIPNTFFAGLIGNPYIYLYSQFGVPNASDGGFEEWSVLTASNPLIAITKTATVVDTDNDDNGDGIIHDADDNISYTITVSNTGNLDLTNVVVKDTIEGYAIQTLGVPGSPGTNVVITE